MSRGWMKTILKLTALSLIVGLVMAAFDVRPMEVFAAVGGAASDVFRRIISALQWAWRYIVLGAVVVVPFWLILCLFRWRRR